LDVKEVFRISVPLTAAVLEEELCPVVPVEGAGAALLAPAGAGVCAHAAAAKAQEKSNILKTLIGKPFRDRSALNRTVDMQSPPVAGTETDQQA
jgi:hypothetical protein